MPGDDDPGRRSARGSGSGRSDVDHLVNDLYEDCPGHHLDVLLLATGIVMERYRLDVLSAHEAMASFAAREHVDVVELSRTIVRDAPRGRSTP